MGLSGAQVAAMWGARADAWSVTTAPTAEPVALFDVKAQLRIDDDESDLLLADYITAARVLVENRTSLALITQTIDVTYDGMPAHSAPLMLPRSPAASVTSVTSYNTSNVAATFASASYRLEASQLPSRIVLNDGYSWPSDLRLTNGVVVRFIAGYGATSASVPVPIRLALKYLVGHWFEERNLLITSGAQPTEIPFAVEALLAPYVVARVA